MNFHVLGIHHLGLAPKDPKKAAAFFDRFCPGLTLHSKEIVLEQAVETQSYAFQHKDDSFLEVLEPLSEDSPIKGFLNKKGGGIHHMALTVDNLAAALGFLKEQGIKLIDEHPRKGANGCLIGFIHPESTGGLLIELVEPCA